MPPSRPNHYATLGLDRLCSLDQIRAAYRILAKKHHPDLNPGSAAALAHTQDINAAYEVLGDPDLRREYDAERARDEKKARPARGTRSTPNLTQDVHLRLDEFFRGATLDVRVNDPGHTAGAEVYPLTIPPETAPGARFKVPRLDGGHVIVRVRVRPDHRFKARGSDLRCDLRIHLQRAAQGGTEMVHGPGGNQLRVVIPRGVARGEILRVPGEGLPKPRGGRGDLLVRVTYRPEVRITRAGR